MRYRDEDPVELGKSDNIKRADGTSLEDVIRSVTLAFSKDGRTLFFIDNRVMLASTLLIDRACCKSFPGRQITGL